MTSSTKFDMKDIKVPTVAEVRDFVEAHGISAALLPDIGEKGTYSEQLLRQQKDTVAYQWMIEFHKVENLSRTCLYCDFVAKHRVSLRAHMKKHVTLK